MIRIDTNRTVQKLHNFWNHIHFHPTDAIEDDWGRAILDCVAADKVATTVRMYAMLEDIVTCDGQGVLHYDFTLNDRRLDYMLSRGFDIFLSYNFIPPFLARDAAQTSAVAKNKTRYKGKMIVTSPPSDYTVWEEICYEYTKHIVERYGKAVVASWHLQCLNEPDIKAFFMGDLENSEENATVRLGEYLQLYRHFAKGIDRACKGLCIGGPSVAKYLNFFEGFLQAAQKERLHLDFVSIHTYGTGPAHLNSGTIPFHAENTLHKHRRYVEILRHYFPHIELIADEWGAASHGFYNIEECPQFAFREGSEYAAYFGKMVAAYIREGLAPSKMMICLSGQHEMVTDFSGFRNFFTLHGIRKPIYNAYVLMRKLGDQLLQSAWDDPAVSVLSTANGTGKLSIMLAYAAEHFDCELPAVAEQLHLDGLVGKRHVTVWQIDESHTNPYKLSLREGMGDHPTEEQLTRLRAEGELKPVADYDIDLDGSTPLSVSFESNALLLIEIA